MNTDFDEVRGKILGRQPLPSLGEVFSKVRRDETRKTIMLGKKKTICSTIYASNNQIDRRVLWSHLQWCASTVGSKPWFLEGDLNTTRFASEKNGGNMNTDTSMEEFH